MPAGFPPDLNERLQQERLAGLVYTMHVTINDDDYTFKGTARVEFTNNTFDTLHQVFFHAHFNAFQPNSLTHKRTAAIGPNRMRPATFQNLKPHEIGKLDILPGTNNGEPFTVERQGTIIRIDLAKPLMPQERANLAFEFVGQVPIQIRRSGRNNAQGVRYSMAQWFPKLCQYDQHGWQNNQFVAREFYGVWGKYDVKITLPAKYIVGATGDLQNPDRCGFGYAAQGNTTVYPLPDSLKPQGTKTWHFIAFPVHDFAWVADADYIHRVVVFSDSALMMPKLTFHILTKPRYDDVWKHAVWWLPRTFRFLAKKYLPYPYKQFTCAQAGDGGMEYPNLVMVRSTDYEGTLGTVVHEAIHQWFYGMVANNETKHAWMDEGITDYLTDRVLQEEFGLEEEKRITWLETMLIPRPKNNLALNRAFLRVYALGYDEPLSIPHDRFNEDMTAVMVYRKGSAWLRQFEYSFGKNKVDELLRAYQEQWRFRHPYPPDFEKIASSVFGQRMDEVFDTFLRGTELPDYSLHSLHSEPTAQGTYKNTIRLSKRERAHVPLRLFATDVVGRQYTFSIPSDMLNAPNNDTTCLAPWFWAASDYTAECITPSPLREVRLDTAGNLLRHDLMSNVIRAQSIFPTLPDVRVGFMTRFDEALPLDEYGVSVRPSVWFDPLGGLQLGVRADGCGAYTTPKITGGVYYNLGNQRVDWQLGYSQMMGGAASGTTQIDIRLCSMDGVTALTSRFLADIRPVRYTREDFRFVSVHSDIWILNDPSYYSTEIAIRDEAFIRLGTAGERRWKTGFIKAEANLAITLVGELIARPQVCVDWGETLWNSNVAGFTVRLFGSIAPGTPMALRYALNTGTVLERFENVPSRFTRFAAYTMGLPVFTPGGAGFVRSATEPMEAIAATYIVLGNRTLHQALNFTVPILSALKPSVWVAGGFALSDMRSPLGNNVARALHFDSGIAVSINLANIVPESYLLWMFKDEVSLTVYVPLISYIASRQWIIGYDGVRVGVSTTIPQ